ncbi:fumarylacetoacetate hydrolase domain-containing protein 2-like [Xenia sp. Carnegie-2017]|uniref:fumarylacetoacetate hydrolase domain-containing protein 2-like n=1 Tax=Xenia sp. Carnegie-2017 TaxID=2897299 RepID=UPI001F047C4B|nr:fumarylacetoacetate hydrolase domain-containing protein 2-like [Xenia sp. Carnegie-2017]
MRFLQFSDEKSTRIGVEIVEDGDIVDISEVDSSIPSDMKSFIEGGEDMLAAAKQAVASGNGVIKRDRTKVKAPIKNPEKIICLGMNYADHCFEQNKPIPERPLLFFKLPNSIIGQGDDIICPDIVEELDYEVELAIVVGKTCHCIKEEDAMDYVFGYTVAHDVSARDWQLRKNNGQWGLGKTFDTFCPLGPVIVQKNGLSDPHKLGIRCRVNKMTAQDSNTEQMVFKTAAAVSYISQFMTLKAGDVILTGTPPGVGCFKTPPVFLKDGDVVEVEIDEIGCLSNKVRQFERTN